MNLRMNKFIVFLKKAVTPFAKAVCNTKFLNVQPEQLQNKKSILIANHVSGWDPLILAMNIPFDLVFLYKKEFHDNPILRWVLDGLDCIPVNRDVVDLSCTKKILKALSQQKTICIYPEGTRNRDLHNMLPFKEGAAMCAIKTKTPIRLVFTWDRFRILKKSYVYISEEFELSEFYDKPLTSDLLFEATKVLYCKMVKLRNKVNKIMEEKGVKRRNYPRAKLKRYEKIVKLKQCEYDKAKQFCKGCSQTEDVCQ